MLQYINTIHFYYLFYYILSSIAPKLSQQQVDEVNIVTYLSCLQRLVAALLPDCERPETLTACQTNCFAGLRHAPNQ